VRAFAIAACLCGLLCANAGVALARPAPARAVTMVFGDVPVAPGSFPDYNPRSFALRGSLSVKPQAFNFASYTNARAMVAWYRRQMPAHGWHIDALHANYPYTGANSLVSSRRGEAVTIVVEPTRLGCRVSIIKLNTAK